MFKFYDILNIIDITDINLHKNLYLLLRSIEELLDTNPDYDKTINLLIKLPLTKSIKLNMVPIENISNEDIKYNLDIFSKLTPYSRNPLEPLFILCISNEKHKKEISEIITDLCRGDIVKALNVVYKLKKENDNNDFKITKQENTPLR